jgi:hypothetical protein
MFFVLDQLFRVQEQDASEKKDAQTGVVQISTKIVLNQSNTLNLLK